MNVSDVMKNRMEGLDLFLAHMAVVVFAFHSDLVIHTTEFEGPENIDLMFNSSSTNKLYIVLYLYIGRAYSVYGRAYDV